MKTKYIILQNWRPILSIIFFCVAYFALVRPMVLKFRTPELIFEYHFIDILCMYGLMQLKTYIINGIELIIRMVKKRKMVKEKLA